MNRERARELWTAYLTGEPLSAGDEAWLAQALDEDSELRTELLRDGEFDGFLRGLGRSDDAGEEAFVAAFRLHWAADRSEDRFVGQVRHRLRSERARVPAHPWTLQRVWLPALLSCGLLVALGLAVVTSGGSRPGPAPAALEPRPLTSEGVAVRPPERIPVPAVEPVRPPVARPSVKEAPTALPAPERPREPGPAPIPSAPERTPAAETAPAIPDRSTVVMKPLISLVIERAEGESYVLEGTRRAPARKGEELLPGQDLETSGAAELRGSDGTRLTLAAQTRVRRAADPGPSVARARVVVTRGTVAADVGRRPGAFPPLAVATPHAEALAGAARLVVRVEPAVELTVLDVYEGQAKVTRLTDGAQVVANAGQYLLVGAGREPLLVRPQADQKRVDEAIRRGVQFLKGANAAGGADRAEPKYLMLWTYVHANVPENDPAFQELFKEIMQEKLSYTYNVVLRALILEEMDRVRYQSQIHQCAQYLVNAQCRNGQWTYNGPPMPALVPSGGGRSDVASGSQVRDFEAGREVREKPKPVRKLTVRRTATGPDTGDNSNSQYAALGLRACHDAGIVLPQEVVALARKWWQESQHEEAKKANPDTATGPGVNAPPAGWCYSREAEKTHPAYGSMTAGAVGSLAIYGYILGDKNWKNEPALRRGISWLTENFSVAGNQGPPEHSGSVAWHYYYYLYALERAGMLCGTETFGAHQWYREGAEVLLAAQGADGAWVSATPHGDRSLITNRIWDTCFAILFLRRATRPLVASEDRQGK